MPSASQGYFFDSHCHLDFDSFESDIDDVLQRSFDAGVLKMCTIGAGEDLRSAQAAIALSERYPNHIVASVGIHPHDAKNVQQSTLDSLQALATKKQVVAIGETGLDYHYSHSPHEVQQEVFRQFIALGKTLKKPIIVHTRNAADDTIRILKEEKASEIGGVIHCFSEDTVFARRALDLGFVSSFSGIVTFKTAIEIQLAAAAQPDDALLIETDAPFLAPIPKRGKRNEPSLLVHTAKKIAELRGQSLERIRELSTRNAEKLYGFDALPA
ncbi:MAG: TatD family hydrolase [Myxococcales bacterium]|nr:MAG: TatD family hydrolase [Myxococcales bacterium]